ncbi:Cation/calcium exchanger 4 [Spathaspora sp. JA1]|nr:Cation/calcium exchanger 4 [Spathaspora sp. JA1]
MRFCLHLIIIWALLALSIESTILIEVPGGKKLIKRENDTCSSQIPLIPPQERCQFITTNCQDHEGLVNYFNFYYCKFGFLKSFAIIPLSICLFILFLSLGVTASEFLCPNLDTISKFLQLSDNLAGLTLLAFGNGAPDMFSTFQAFTWDAGSLAIAELIGASLFIVTVVVGTIAVLHPFEVPQNIFLRDAAMYIFIVFVVIISLLVGSLSLFTSSLLVVAYVLYVGAAVYNHSSYKAKVAQLLKDQRSRDAFADTVHRDIEEIDEIYLDNLSRLPTIDDLRLNNESVNEYLTFQDMPHESISKSMTSSAGTYGLRMLLKDLSVYSNSSPGNIYLSRDRELTSPSNNVTSIEMERQGGDFEEVDNNKFDSEVVKFLFPRLSEFDNANIPDKIFMIFSFPVNTLLRLTNPVRNRITIEELNQAIRNSETDFDYEQDKRFLVFQTAAGFIFLIVNSTSSTSRFWSIGLPLGIVSTFALTYLVNIIYPDGPSSVRFASRINTINYFAAFLGFIVSISWISIFAGEIINILKTISVIYNLSDDILGITVFALGNSIGDFISNYTIAKMGMPIMAFAACFGGPLLALCSLGLTGLIVIPKFPGKGYSLSMTRTLAITSSALIVNLMFLLYIIPRNNWMLDKTIGKILIFNWFIAITLCIISEFI